LDFLGLGILFVSIKIQSSSFLEFHFFKEIFFEFVAPRRSSIRSIVRPSDRPREKALSASLAGQGKAAAGPCTNFEGLLREGFPLHVSNVFLALSY